MGALLLDESLDLGEYRELTEEELALLQTIKCLRRGERKRT